MIKKTFFCLIVLQFLTFSPVNGQINYPDFPSCVNPSGTVKAYYGSGTHGIVGNTDIHEGSDIVYQIDGNNVLTQCFCSMNGPDGIQTNWWKISSLTENEISILQNDGWILVPDGSAWGLDSSSYMAKNSSYTCRNLVIKTDSNSSNGGTGGSNSTSNNLQGVLGLAFTGGMVAYYAIFAFALISTGIGLVLISKKS